MKKSVFFTLIFGAALVAMTACKTKLDWNELDKSATVKANATVPLGTVRVTAEQLLHFGNAAEYMRFDEDGSVTIVYKDTFHKEFHYIDLTEYITTTNKTFHLVDAEGGELIPGSVIPAGTPLTLTFPAYVSLTNVNNNTSQERLDSMVINQARFTSTISLKNGLELKDSDVKHVYVRMGENFIRAAGKVKEIPFTGFGTEIPINVDNFNMCFMKDRAAQPSATNVVDSVGFEFIFEIVPSQDIVVNNAKSFYYTFGIELLEYRAIFGHFEPSEHLDWEERYDIGKDLSFFDSLIVPVREPKVKMSITHRIGAPINLFVKGICSYNNTPGDTVWATFDGNRTWTKPFQNFIRVTDPLEDSVTNIIYLDNTDANGNLDILFSHDIKEVYYGYTLKLRDRFPNASETPCYQHRMTTDRQIAIDMEVEVPLLFNNGLVIQYNDTVKDMNLGKVNFDSIATGTDGIIREVKDSTRATLYLVCQNDFPFDMKITLAFLNENGNPIDLGIAPFIINGNYKNEGLSIIPALTIDKERAEKLSKAKNLHYIVNAKFNGGKGEVNWKQDLKIHAVAAANIEAAIDFGKLQKKQAKDK